MALRSRLRATLQDRSATLWAAALVADNIRGSILHHFGRIHDLSGSTHGQLSVNESIQYIESGFRNFQTFGGVAVFRGSVAEVGPGDNAGNALLFRRSGCANVDLIDRFHSVRDREVQERIYRMLSERHDLDEFRLGDSWDEKELSGIRWMIGTSAEDYFGALVHEAKRPYDFIISRSVLQHLYDPLSALRNMILCLKPGGKAIHVVDLRDIGLFSASHGELRFLSFPSPIWRWMTRETGRSNRQLVHRYRWALDGLKQRGISDHEILIRRLVRIGVVEPAMAWDDIPIETRAAACDAVNSERHRFAAEFRDVPTEDLAVAGIVLVVHRRSEDS